MTKDHLRNRFRALRESLSAQEVTSESANLCQRLASWSVLQKAETVLTYLAFRNEPDLALLLELFPAKEWVVPRVAKQRLVLHPYDAEHLVRHRFGMLEPEADLPTIAAANLDLVLVPGVAFARDGGRLGFGGGYYDRLLPTTPATRAGIAFECCLVDTLPCDDHDQRMDWVATPAQIIRTAPL